MVQLDNYNLWQRIIYDYIEAYHPYMAENMDELKEMIILRAEIAEKVYKDASFRGETPYECHRLALEELHAGLEFSPISYLKELCFDKHGYDLTNVEACDIYRNQEVKDIFEKYGTNIEGDYREMELIKELIPFLEQYEGKGDLSKKLIDVWNIPIEWDY
jgi:hypothetical protein